MTGVFTISTQFFIALTTFSCVITCWNRIQIVLQGFSYYSTDLLREKGPFIFCWLIWGYTFEPGNSFLFCLEYFFLSLKSFPLRLFNTIILLDTIAKKKKKEEEKILIFIHLFKFPKLIIDGWMTR